MIVDGTIVISSCFQYYYTYNVTYRYAEGSCVYNCLNSIKGKLEKICIKKVRINSDIVIYQDTFNGFWNENDLCTHSEALANAIAYWEAKQAALAELIEDQC